MAKQAKRARRILIHLGSVLALTVPAFSWSLVGATGVAAAGGCSSSTHAHLELVMRAAYQHIEANPGYTGIALPEDCGAIDVYGTAGSASSIERALNSSTAFRVHSVRNSLASLLKVQATITSQYSALRGRGLDIRRYWPDMTSGLERIEVEGATPAQLSALASEFGAAVDPVAVKGAPTIAPARDPSNDIAPPYDGADFIEYTDAQTATEWLCTGAFGLHDWTNNGLTENYFMLTAGHCSVSTPGDQGCNAGCNNQPISGTAWINAAGTPGLSGSLAPIGTVVGNSLGNQIDGALISVASRTSTQEWNGWYTSANLNAQWVSNRALAGQTACMNGAYEGENCGGVVQTTGYLGCLTVQNFSKPWCDTIEAKNTSGGVIGGEGDSGGGVIGLAPQQYSEGIISAESIENKSCPHFTWRGNVCSDTIFFTDLPSIINFFAAGGYPQLQVNTPSSP